VGHGFYEYLGWKNVAKPFGIDLREFVSGASGGDMGWGTYTYYFVMRLPKTAVVDDSDVHPVMRIENHGCSSICCE
jgi:hypothetical protein